MLTSTVVVGSGGAEPGFFANCMRSRLSLRSSPNATNVAVKRGMPTPRPIATSCLVEVAVPTVVFAAAGGKFVEPVVRFKITWLRGIVKGVRPICLVVPEQLLAASS